jgi:hypothetical protein
MAQELSRYCTCWRASRMLPAEHLARALRCFLTRRVRSQAFIEKGTQMAKKVRGWGLTAVKLSARYGGKAMWVVSTTALITLFPLLLELQREGHVLEIEALQVI